MYIRCLSQCGSFFFFQAEDGIRDKLVTGVQTCALPISMAPSQEAICLCAFTHPTTRSENAGRCAPGAAVAVVAAAPGLADFPVIPVRVEIGRASCRERV